jgi:hypothetical protein
MTSLPDEKYQQRKAELLDEVRDETPEEKPAKAAPTKEKKKQKETEYVVLSSAAESGPWAVVGDFMAHGQLAAKKLAAEKIGDRATNNYFIAIPTSSYAPQRPAVKTTTVITFG